MPMPKGSHHTDETKARMSASRKGRRKTDETKAKLSASLKGHAVSEDTRAKISVRGTSHGGSRTRLYRCWTSMRNRCSSPNSKSWKHYGGRGITVCEAWATFVGFRTWAVAAGYEEGLSIDRIDANGGYEPGNCQWVTVAENSRRGNVTRRDNPSGRVGACSRWNISRGKPCVCGSHG